MVSYAMPSKGSKVKHIQLRFLALPNMYCDFSGFPESFQNIMYGTWWKTLILCNFALRILICLTHFSWNLAQSDEPWSSFACKDWDAPFIPKHDTLAYYQFTCLWLTWIFYNHFTFMLPLSQLFWNVSQQSKKNLFMCRSSQKKICSYLQNTITLVSENFGNLFFVLFSNK